MSTVIRHTDTNQIAITELVWADGGRSFEARLPDGTDLNEDGCFDEVPTDRQMCNLHPRAGCWICPGCHCSIDGTQAGMVADHVRGLVDGAGAGHPLTPGG